MAKRKDRNRRALAEWKNPADRIIILLIAVPVVAVCLFYASLPLPSDSAHKVAHFSFDDVYDVLLDITEHEPVYASAFDNPFLGSLKRLHELYEAKFVLYVYDTYPEAAFDIADVSVKYQSEFMANSGWLKFGYHTIEPTTSFDKETSLAAFKTSFSKVKDAIGRFAGEASFSNVLRLNYFRGDDDKVAFLASQGITALLCADDDRASYNLPETQNLLLQKNDYIVYQDMKYFKTDLRLDRIRFITYELLQLRDQETVVIFAHEWALVDIGFDRIESAVRWLVRNGYAFSYLED